MAKEKKKNPSEGDHRDSNSNGGKIITDSRFSGLHSDPRFQRIPKNESKVHIDSRFQRMFSDKNFSSSSRLDKRGKKKKNNSKNPLLHYYHQEQEGHEEGNDAEPEEKKTSYKEEEEEEVEAEEEKEEDRPSGKKSKSKQNKIKPDSEASKEENLNARTKKTRKRKTKGETGDGTFDEDDCEFMFKSKEKKNKKKKIPVSEDDAVGEDVGSEYRESGEKESTITNSSLETKCRSSSESELLEEEDNFNQSESETSSVSSSSSSEEDDDGETDSEPELPDQEDVPAIEHATNRLAVVDMDWNHVKAVDLYVLMSSFLPKGGQISSVAIYPSEFGLNRMAEEEVRGPSGIFDSDEENGDNDDDEDGEIDNEKLRAYEKSRLRYYYAVVDCDSTSTADHLYKTCDGLEFERTSNVLDLRFIPDTLDIKHPPCDIATEAPVSYGGLDFHTRALQHSKIHLSWDDDEPQRAKILKHKFNSKQLDELEFKDFLASDEDETCDDESDEAGLPDNQSEKLNKRDKYRTLVQSGDGADADDNDDHDMEVTFSTGLENLSKHIIEKQKNKEAETVWEAYLRKKREKKAARKKKASKFSSEDDSTDSYEEVPDQADDFFIQEGLDADSGSRLGMKGLKEKKQSQEIDQEQEASKGELELLVADEKGIGESVKGYNLKPKKRDLKVKKQKEMLAEDKLPTVDYDDPRFSSLFKNHHFALDPTDPQFKRSAAYARQLAQKQAKGGKIVEEEQINSTRHDPLESGGTSQKKDKDDLSLLIQSVKKKARALKC